MSQTAVAFGIRGFAIIISSSKFGRIRASASGGPTEGSHIDKQSIVLAPNPKDISSQEPSCEGRERRFERARPLTTGRARRPARFYRYERWSPSADGRLPREPAG